MSHDLDTTIWPSRPLAELLDMRDDEDFGPAIYSGRTSLCLDCGALLSAEAQRLAYDLCGRCGMDEDDLVQCMEGPSV